jgi:MFS family permease
MAPLHGTTGIMAAQFVSFFIAQALGHDRCCEIGWRIMFGAGALPSVIQLFWALGLPESPRWCRQRGLYEKADENTEYLVSLGCGIDTLTRSLSQNSIGTNGSRGGDPDKIGVQRGAIAVGLSVMQQLSGVNAVVFYAPILYKQLGMASNIAILIAGCNSVAQVLMTRLMTVIIDSWGRRCICLIGLMGMFIGLVVLGSVFSHLLNVQVFVVNICAVVGVLIFRLSFSLSLGPLPYIMVTELFPQRHRARGVAMSMMTNWLLNWGVVLSVPILMHNFDGMVFFGFAGVCVVSGIIVDLYLPETAGVDLDDDDGANMHQGTIRKVCKTLSKVFRRSASREPSLLGQNASDNSEGNSVASGVPSEVNSGVPSENSGLPKTANAQKVDVQDAVKKVLDNKV